MRHTKMAEWMENVEKSISRIMADKVYTSAEFKRERDNFHVSHGDTFFKSDRADAFLCRLSAKTWSELTSRNGSSRFLTS